MGKYRVLIIGAGKMGAFFDSPEQNSILTHAHAFSKNNRFKLIGFLDKNYQKATRAAKIWGGRAFQSLREAFSKEKIDIVTIAVPDELHDIYLKQAADYPVKLIFMEKPFATGIKSAKSCIDIIQKRDIPILLNYSRRFVPEFNDLKLNIKAGNYGEYLTGNGYYGKGVLHNGSHMLDLLRFLLDEIEIKTRIDYIYDYKQNDPSVSAVLNVNSKDFFLNFVDSRQYTIFEIDLLFEYKRVRMVDSGFKLLFYDIEESPIYQGYKNIVYKEEVNTSLGNALSYAIDNIDASISKGQALECTMIDGLRVLEIAESLKKGIEYEKQKNSFVSP